MGVGAVEDAEFQLPEGSLVEVKMVVRLPAAATEAEIDEWVNHMVAQQGAISLDNPLYPHAAEAWGSSGLSWEDTGDVGREEHFDHKPSVGGGASYRVRFHRERREP